jgi:transcriptional regulator with XRE-family HTH domain
MEPTMEKIVAMFEASGKTLDQLGQEMGYDPDSARKAAWQFLKKTSDPRLSMLKRFAKAMDISIEELVAEKKRSRRK